MEVFKDSADTKFLNHNKNSIPSMQLLFWFVHYTLTNYRLPMNNLTPGVTRILYMSDWRLEKKSQYSLRVFVSFSVLLDKFRINA